MSMIKKDTRSLVEMANDLIPDIIADSEALHQASPFAIMAGTATWALTDTELNSVRNMSDDELRRAVIEDIQNVDYWERHNKRMVMCPADLTRHVDDPEQKIRIMDAYAHKDVQRFLIKYTDGSVRINTLRADEAQDYCGVYLDC